MQEKQKRYKETNQTTRKRSNLVLLGRTDLVIRTTWYLLLKKILSLHQMIGNLILPYLHIDSYTSTCCFAAGIITMKVHIYNPFTIVYKILSNFYLFCHSTEIKGEKYKYLHFVDVILPSKHHLSKI